MKTRARSTPLQQRSWLEFLWIAALVLFGPIACSAYEAAQGESADEGEMLVEALGLETGDTVADVGAGDGDWTVVLAEAVGPTGKVWATEVKEDLVEEIRERAAEEGLDQVEAVLGDQDATGLPEGCCDAILLRMVYHHFVDPEVMRADLKSALRPGGRLVVVDITPQESWRDLPDVPERGGHGVGPGELIADLEADGFVVVERSDEWPGEEDKYCVVFRLGL